MLANRLAPPLKTRSRRTNGKLIAGLDGRSALGRRVRDLADDFAAQLGGWSTLTPLQTTAVKRASELSALAEEARADALRKASIDPLALSRLERLRRPRAPRPWACYWQGGAGLRANA